MRVLVLGGTGLISTPLTQFLLDAGHEVVLFNRGRSANPYEGRVTVVLGERDSREALERAASTEPDVVIDMICYEPDDLALSLEVFRGRIQRYVFCSTVDVHTKPPRRLPGNESSEQDPPKAFLYAWKKQRCEELLAASGMEFVSIRPSATYLDSAVPSVGSFDLALERIREGKPLIMHGDGYGIWGACHRDAVARAFVAAIDSAAAAGNGYIVAGHEPLTWMAYWQGVFDVLGVQPELIHIPAVDLAAIDPEFASWVLVHFQFPSMWDCSAAARDLGFESTVDWADGIAAGLPHRVPGEVKQADRDSYDRIVQTWLDRSPKSTA